MTDIIPLQVLPNQEINVVLEDKPVRLNVYQKSTGLYMDIHLNDELIIAGVICLNRVFIVLSDYLGFPGDLGFVDMEGDNDPDYLGLAERYLLVYYHPDELA